MNIPLENDSAMLRSLDGVLLSTVEGLTIGNLSLDGPSPMLPAEFRFALPSMD